MPLFEYQCKDCESILEIFQHDADHYPKHHCRFLLVLLVCMVHDNFEVHALDSVERLVICQYFAHSYSKSVGVQFHEVLSIHRRTCC